MTENSVERQSWVLQALEQYESRLLRFAARMLGDENLARDAVQHAFLRLCGRSPHELDGRVGPWLFAVCRNQAIDQLRRRGGSEEVADCPDCRSTPDETAEQADLYDRINRLVDQLPLPQREAVALWSEGFSYRQIAETVGATEGNVRVIVHRALKSIRQNPAVLRLINS